MDKQKTQSKKLSPKEQQEFESFKKWLTDKNYSPKNEEEVKKYYAQYQQEKAKASTEQKQKALHGAKLNYFRTLKHQCEEDEELYYYKKGGRVGCGCKKKEDGGEVTKAEKGTAVDKFKKAKKGFQVPQQINPNDTIHINGQIRSLTDKPIKDKNNTYKSLTLEEYKKLKDKDKNRVDIKDAAHGRQVHKCGGKVKRDCGGSKLKACNGAVAKFKIHRQGGSLNGIPFTRKAQ